jgi:hypothetical protein
VSLLYAEYNEETAMRVHDEELMEDVAIRLLKRGYPVEEVAEDTGLSEAMVVELKKELT